MNLLAIWNFLNQPIGEQKERPYKPTVIIREVHPMREPTAKEMRSFASYVSHFLSLNSAPDLLPLFAVGQHGTLKEIAESWAMLRAALDNIRSDTKKGKVRVVVIGDGATARTGALFAYMMSDITAIGSILLRYILAMEDKGLVKK